MADVNTVIFTGRLTRQAELKSTNSGKYLCNIDIAIDNSYKNSKGDKVEDVCFIQCTAWEKLAEIISKHTDKGHRVGITGTLKLQRWESEGKKHQKHYVLIEKFTFLEGKKDGQKPNNSGNTGNAIKEEFGGQSFNEPFNDDIPF